MTTNYIRNVLLTMDSSTRRALREVARARVNTDPDETDPMTRIWFAMYAQIVDLEYEEGEILRQLETNQP